MSAFSQIKISTKLVLIGAAFLVPIFIMLYVSANPIIESIGHKRQMLEGLKTIRPATQLLPLVSQHLRVRLGFENGNLARVEDQINAELRIIERRGPAGVSLTNGWLMIKSADDTRWRQLLKMYFDYLESVAGYIKDTSEESGLIFISDLSGHYFMGLGTEEIPRLMVRLLQITNVIRSAVFMAREANAQSTNDDGIQLLIDNQNNSLTEYLLLIKNSENSQIRESLSMALNNLTDISDTHKNFVTSRLTPQIDGYSNEIVEYYEFITAILNGKTKIERMEDLTSAAIKINTFVHALLESTLDELGFILNDMLDEDLWSIYKTFSIVIVIVVSAMLVLFLTSISIHRSSKNMKQVLDSLANNDLTMTLKVESRDEFGELMIAFNGFLKDLRTIFESFKTTTNTVTASVYDLSSASREISTTANEQSAGISEIVSTMEGNNNLSQQIALKTGEVAMLAEQMHTLISRGAALRDANQTLVDEIRNQNNKIIVEIKNLAIMISRISEAIRIIDSISDQTKLIAFNASLEASSSGESGARFAVVATEIRRFADNVAESTNEIKKQIEEATKASQSLISEANNGSRQIEHGYERMSEQKTVFEDIVSNAHNVAARNMQISNLSKQQEYASSQIFETLKEVSTGVRQFVLATSSNSKIADDLGEMSERLKIAVNRYITKRD
ncbi:hypothetical protein FACS189487_02220 [Campylobacterota bacterium]|nr:hypothetical protein FACS189487_02220 [Campylobacterota bacterium]